MILDYIFFEEKIDVKALNEKLLNKALYDSQVENDKLVIDLQGESDVQD